MAALGPAALVVAAALKVKEKISEEVEAFKAAIGDVAGAAKALASNDNLGAISQASDAAAYALDKFGVVGGAAATSLKAFVGGLAVASDVVESFVKRGQQLADYSAELSGAGARQEIRSLLADLKEAQELGPDLARLTDGFGELQMELRDALLPIKKWLVENLADFVEWLRGAVTEGRVMGEQALALVKLLPELIAAAVRGEFGEATRSIDLTLRMIRLNAERRQREQAEAELVQPIDAQLRQLERAVFVDPPRPGGGEVIDVIRPPAPEIPPGGF